LKQKVIQNWVKTKTPLSLISLNSPNRIGNFGNFSPGHGGGGGVPSLFFFI
jgi:hypothetical protein